MDRHLGAPQWASRRGGGVGENPNSDRHFLFLLFFLPLPLYHHHHRDPAATKKQSVDNIRNHFQRHQACVQVGEKMWAKKVLSPRFVCLPGLI